MRNLSDVRVTSAKIVNDLIDTLKKPGHIAYIRFASVCRSFKDELNKLLK